MEERSVYTVNDKGFTCPYPAHSCQDAINRSADATTAQTRSHQQRRDCE